MAVQTCPFLTNHWFIYIISISSFKKMFPYNSAMGSVAAQTSMHFKVIISIVIGNSKIIWFPWVWVSPDNADPSECVFFPVHRRIRVIPVLFFVAEGAELGAIITCIRIKAYPEKLRICAAVRVVAACALDISAIIQDSRDYIGIIDARVLNFTVCGIR